MPPALALPVSVGGGVVSVVPLVLDGEVVVVRVVVVGAVCVGVLLIVLALSLELEPPPQPGSRRARTTATANRRTRNDDRRVARIGSMIGARRDAFRRRRVIP